MIGDVLWEPTSARWADTNLRRFTTWLRTERGVEAEATRQATRGNSRNYDPLWRIKAREEGRLRNEGANTKSGVRAQTTRAEAMQAWTRIGRALAESGDPDNLRLAASLRRFIMELPATGKAIRQDASERSKSSSGRGEPAVTRDARPAPCTRRSSCTRTRARLAGTGSTSGTCPPGSSTAT